ncbi:MAG: 3-hydroxyacyl-CoA dehydrogenase family protein [Hyphomicrobiaceae bacterium]
MTVQLPGNLETRPMTVLGAGTLGRRIALMLATQGGEVRLYDLAPRVREEASEFIAEHLPEVVRQRGNGKAGHVIAEDNLTSALSDSWLVVEAIPEKLELKRQVFGDLDRQAPADAVLASNSSSYPTSEFINRVEKPERVLNTHFMMPPEISSVELMANGKTDPAIMKLMAETLPRYGFTPYLVEKESIGFIFNRIWAAIKREALTVVAEGVAEPKAVDAIFAQNFGMKDGPCRMMDKVGLDVVLAIEEHYAHENPNLSETPRKLLKNMIASGRLGQKSGRGFYDYQA